MINQECENLKAEIEAIVNLFENGEMEVTLKTERQTVKHLFEIAVEKYLDTHEWYD